MSQARVYHTAKVRKDWTCEKCGAAIRKGQDGRISFAVGFRGYEHTRCTKPECAPTRSELESSAVASVYAAIDDVDFDQLDSKEDIEYAVQEVAEAISEVADEYEQNEMFEINPDLQERVETLRAAEAEVDVWEFDGDEEPEEDEECQDCDGTGEVEVEVDGSDVPNQEPCENCDGTGHVDNTGARDEWLESVREAAREVLDGLELP